MLPRTDFEPSPPREGFVVSGVREGSHAMSLALLLYVIAFILLVLAGLGVSAPRVSLGWLAMALWLFAAAILPVVN